MRRWALGVVLLAGAMGYCTFRPVCVPISTEEVARWDPPIETRTDRDFYLKIFQRRDGQWYQCKTWISREMFF